MSKKIIVVGAGGQLGRCIEDIIRQDGCEANVTFLSHNDLDITIKDDVYKEIFGCYADVVINCAAYTNVCKAESELVNAYRANVLGPTNLAQACKKVGTKFIHISTDFVFDGKSNIPYKETDNCAPVNFYGMSKYLGELSVLDANPDSIIIRTSWLYSEYGSNFVTKMIEKIRKESVVKVVYDVLGSPTYAFDLAEFILSITREGKINEMSGIYHYCNSGAISRYDFAAEIERKYFGQQIVVKPCLSTEFQSDVDRPVYSVLDRTKTEGIVGKTLPDWNDSLSKCIEKIKGRDKGDE